VNLNDIKTQHPNAYETIYAEALKAGAEAERSRIQSVLSISFPGYSSLVETLAFDGTTTAPEAAVKIVEAHRIKVSAPLHSPAHF
jgi:hypothetical protein